MRRGWSAPSGTLDKGVSGGPKHKDVGDGDRSVGDAEHVSDHAADTGVGAAERLDCRGVVVGLGLERDRDVASEADDPGVADERRLHERRIDRLGAVAQHLDQGQTVLAVVGRDRGTERLVGTVLAPGLSQRFEFDVGRFAAEVGVVGLDDPELLRIECEAALDADRQQLVHRLADDLDGVGDAGGDALGVEGRLDAAGVPSLDHRVGDHPPDDAFSQVVVDPTELDPSAGRCAGDRHAELVGGVEQARGGGVGDAGQEGDLGPGLVRVAPPAQLEEGVDEEAVQLVESVLAEIALQEDQVGDPDLEPVVGCQPELVRSRLDGCRPRVGVDGTDRQAVPGDHWREPTRSNDEPFAFGRKFSTARSEPAATRPIVTGSFRGGLGYRARDGEVVAQERTRRVRLRRSGRRQA